jgi:hypothetical protein
MEDKVAKLEDEVKALKKEVTVLKRALRNKIARYEIEQIKHGHEVRSIIELE